MKLNARFSTPIDHVINQVHTKYKIDSSNVLRKLALDLYAEIIKGTPVDTGRARANWNLSVHSPNYSVSNSTIISSVSITAGSLQNLPEVYISNGLPYVRELEFGRSDQAPNGFIRLAIQRVLNQRI